MFGGLGLGLLTSFFLWVFDAPVNLFLWALAAWTAWTGLLMLIRFSIDEASVVWMRAELYRKQQRIDELEEECDRLDDLAVKHADERDAALAGQTRSNSYVPPVPKTIESSWLDAEHLIMRRYGKNQPVTKRHMLDEGWSQDRYTRAMGVLRRTGIVDGTGNAITWAQYDSPAQALAYLDTAPQDGLDAAPIHPYEGGLP